eukprot:2042032-Prymnesium_polylepis.1
MTPLATLSVGSQPSWPANPLAAATGDKTWLRGVDSPPLGAPRDATVVEQAELPQLSAKVFLRAACAASARASSVPRIRPCVYQTLGIENATAADAPPRKADDLPRAYRAWG